MIHNLIRSRWSTIVLLAGAAAAQNPCSTNLVPNGTFTSVFGDAWQARGPVVITPATFATNGVASSPCLALGANTQGRFSVTQSSSMMLQAGVPYEFSLDVFITPGRSVQVEFELVDATGQVTLAGTTSAGRGHERLALDFAPTAAGPYHAQVSMQERVSGLGGRQIHIDNYDVHPAATIRFNVEGSRAAGSTATLAVYGNPNTVFGLIYSLGPRVTPGLRVGGCAGKINLQLPAVDVVYTSLDLSGAWRQQMAVPTALAGVPIEWQAGSLPPTCAFGCPVMIGFP